MLQAWIDFYFPEDEVEIVAKATEPVVDETSTLEPPLAFMITIRNMPESSSPGKNETTTNKLITETPRRRKIEIRARVPFLGTLPEEELEVHHPYHGNRTGCWLNRLSSWKSSGWYCSATGPSLC